MRKINLLDQRFGKLVVIEFLGNYSHGITKWKCRCDCGEEVITRHLYLKTWRSACDKCMGRNKYKDYTGQKIGKVTVIERAEDKINKHGHPIIQWRCSCECGESILRTSRLLNRGNCCCHMCRSENDRKLFWKGYKEIPRPYWNSIKKGAELRNIVFDLTEEYIWNIFEKQDRKCAISGIDIVFSKTKKGQQTGETTASLDRIDPLKGYIQGNVQWVYKWINCMKYDFTDEEFIDLCRKVVNYQDGKLNENKIC